MAEKTWGQLEYQAMSESAAERVDAIVKSHAKVDKFLKGMQWGSELRYAIQSVRYKVVHTAYNPTVEEALRAVRAFFDLWKEKNPFNKDIDPDPDDVDDLERAAILYEREDARWFSASSDTQIQKASSACTEQWDAYLDRAAGSLNMNERIQVVKEAYSATIGVLRDWYSNEWISSPYGNLEQSLNEAYAAARCGMRCDDVMRWAFSFGKRVTSENYRPSLQETYRAVQVFREIFYLLDTSDYLLDASTEDLYKENCIKAYTEPQSVANIAAELNINMEGVVDLANQLDIQIDPNTHLVEADKALLICQSFRNGLLKVKTTSSTSSRGYQKGRYRRW